MSRNLSPYFVPLRIWGSRAVLSQRWKSCHRQRTAALWVALGWKGMSAAELLLPFHAEAKKTIKSASGETAMFPFCLKQQQNVLLKAIKTTKKGD